jgi:hypothetical protein
MKYLVSGNEAVAMAAHDCGVNLGCGYPGTPSSEILHCMSPVVPFCNAKTGILCAFGFCAIMFVLLFALRKRLGNSALLLAAFIFALAVPLLLPHMHERYFFIADVLSLAVAFILPKAAPVPALCSFASLLGYHAYLKNRFLLLMHWGFCALAFALIMALLLISECLEPTETND